MKNRELLHDECGGSFSFLFAYTSLVYNDFIAKSKYISILLTAVATTAILFYYPYTFVTSVDSLDWKDYGTDSIIKTVTCHKHLGNGSIILCHNGAKYTAKALGTMIRTLREQGYEIVPISELIYKENYHMDHEGRQIKN